jgi:CheY-like chemotaxis protein
MSTHHVLVVEDDAETRESLRDLLELEGYTVQTAAHGGEALAQLSRLEPPCLILLDLMMPVMNGWELLAELHRRQRRSDEEPPPIVIVSAARDALGDPEAEGYPILPKPVDVEALLEMVRDQCCGDREGHRPA